MKKLWSAIAGYWHVTDRWLLLFWLFASGVSLLFLTGVYNSGLVGSGQLVSQAGAIGLGLCAAIVISVIDYNLLLKLWKLYVPILLILIFLTATSFGVQSGGNQAWLPISFAGFSTTIQPSEFLKIAFITTFALHLDKVKEHMNAPLHVLLLCLHGLTPVVLIQLLQGDSGTALIFLAIFAVMLFCAGLSWRYIAAAVAAAVAIIPVLWLYILTDNQKMRILVLLNPDRDPDLAFQQARSAIALGVGGVQGTGIFAGRHVPVPKVYNDFIFSFIGESSGFMGCLGVIVLLSVLSFKVLYNSRVAKDEVGRLICIGVFAMLVSQTAINLGMCIGLLPVIGVTLPLFSAGGSSMLALYCGLGLVLSVYCHSNTALFYEK